MTKPAAIVWIAVVCVLCLAFFGFGRLTGFNAGVKHAERTNVAPLPGVYAALAEVRAAGGFVYAVEANGVWTAKVVVDGVEHVASADSEESAIFAAVEKWKGL